MGGHSTSKYRNTRFELARWVTQDACKIKFNLGTSEVHGTVVGPYLPKHRLEIGGGKWEGDPDLKELLARRYGTKFENIATACGASEANYLVHYAFLRLNRPWGKGGRGTVLVERPIYSPLKGIGDILGAKVIDWERRFENGFSLDLEALKSKVKGVDLIVLTNLHNPSGVAITPKEMRAAAEIAADAGAHILCDEVFRDFAPEATGPTFRAGDNCITTCSGSKFQGAGGIKVGWIVATEDIIDKVNEVREMTSCTCSRTDEVMMQKVLKDKKLAMKNRALTMKNLALVADFVERTAGVSWFRPPNGTVCFPRFKGLKDSKGFASYLLKKYHTLISPGFFFGSEGHMRFGLGMGPKVVDKGLELVSKGWKEFRK